jgi:hypothetical protein
VTDRELVLEALAKNGWWIRPTSDDRFVSACPAPPWRWTGPWVELDFSETGRLTRTEVGAPGYGATNPVSKNKRQVVLDVINGKIGNGL